MSSTSRTSSNLRSSLSSADKRNGYNRMMRRVLLPKPQVSVEDHIGGVTGAVRSQLNDSHHGTDTSSTVGSDYEYEDDTDEEAGSDSEDDESIDDEDDDLKLLELMAADIMRFSSRRSVAAASPHRNVSNNAVDNAVRRNSEPKANLSLLTVVRQDETSVPDLSAQTRLGLRTSTSTKDSEKATPSKRENDCSPTQSLLKMVEELGGAEDLFVPTRNVEDYFLKHTPEQIAAYTSEFVRALRRQDLPEIRRMHTEKRHILQASNQFGETVIHIACRRGALDILKYLVEEGGVSIRVRDDYGRTPLHDCCWAAEPNVELMTYLVHLEPDMLFMTDVKGFTPLEYARAKHRSTWNKFLEDIRDVVASKCRAGRLKCSV